MVSTIAKAIDFDDSLADDVLCRFSGCECWIAKSSKTGLIVRQGGQFSRVNMTTRHSLELRRELKELRFVQMVSPLVTEVLAVPF